MKFPDLDAFDWKGLAERQMAGYNRAERVMEYHSWNSQFLRLTHLMGFENGLCALYEEPVAWQAAQPSNDIEWVIKTYGDRMSVIGGYDTQGLPALPTATEEQIINEVTRCMETYGKYGRSYGFMGFLLADADDQDAARKTGILMSEAVRQGRAILSK